MTESKRAILRRQEAIKRDKASKFRRCYIGQKFTSVPCDEDGDLDSGYSPGYNGHPFDTAMPRTGANMLEDIDVSPPQRTRRRQTEPFGKAGSLVTVLSASDDDASSAGEAVAEDLEDTLAEGARWLQEQEELAQRRQEEGTPSTRRRRASARAIVISSSPDTDMSNFVVQSSSPLAAQVTPRNAVPLSRASKERQKAYRGLTDAAPTLQGAKKRKRTEKDITGAPPTSQHGKRARATPNTTNSAHTRKVAVVSLAAVPSAKKAKVTTPQAAAKPSKKPSKRVCSVL